MRKRIQALLICFVLPFSLALGGCGKSGEGAFGILREAEEESLPGSQEDTLSEVQEGILPGRYSRREYARYLRYSAAGADAGVKSRS